MRKFSRLVVTARRVGEYVPAQGFSRQGKPSEKKDTKKPCHNLSLIINVFSSQKDIPFREKHKTRNTKKMNSPEKINALLVEQAIRSATGDGAKGIGIQGLLMICAVVRLGNPPARAVAKSTGRSMASVAAQLNQISALGYLRSEKDDVYMVNHYSATPKGLGLFSPRVMAPAPEPQA